MPTNIVILTRNTEAFSPPQKPQRSAPLFLFSIFSFLDLLGRAQKAWKIVRAPPLGPQSPACCASPYARLITGIGGPLPPCQHGHTMVAWPAMVAWRQAMLACPPCQHGQIHAGMATHAGMTLAILAWGACHHDSDHAGMASHDGMGSAMH